MTRRFLTAAMALALATPACAVDEAEQAGEEMTELEEAETRPMTEVAGAAAASTVQSELLADLGQLREKYVGLAEAMPESDYGWRPAEGVRSVSEVFMHVAAANVGIVMSALELEAPEGADWYTQEAESITDKATVVGAVGISFDFLASAIDGTSDDQLMEDTDLFGLSTLRAVLTFTLAHGHEHLGQSIAYARVNGVAPPWSM